MQFINSSDIAIGKQALQDCIISTLSDGKKVLWLFSGGSNIAISVQIMQAIPFELTENLTVLPIDERFGEPGHANSNYTQLIAANFDIKDGIVHSALQTGYSFEQATAAYDQTMREAFDSNDLVVAQLGIGPDAHIAGILPNSPAALAGDADQYVIGYESSPYTRMTASFVALKQVDVSYVFAFGDSKKDAIQAIQANNQPLQNVPSEILYQLETTYVYTDQSEGAL